MLEKETLALISSLQHFESYVTMAQPHTTILMAHNPLVFIDRMKNKNRGLLVWSLALQEFNLKIEHISGMENKCANAQTCI